jgi:hypothetical protein
MAETLIYPTSHGVDLQFAEVLASWYLLWTHLGRVSFLGGILKCGPLAGINRCPVAALYFGIPRSFYSISAPWAI